MAKGISERMKRNIQCLIQACQQQGYRYEIIDKEQNFVRIFLAQGWEYFVLNRAPFNSEAFHAICKDKSHTYQLLNNMIHMPTTLSVLDFGVRGEYRQYLEYDSVDAVLQAVHTQLQYPVIVKPNQGALGEQVHLCANDSDVRTALGHIFNEHSRYYDYMALVQQFIPTQAEYRLICLYGEPMFAYSRGNAATFNVKYWEHNEHAMLVDDIDLMQELHAFIAPVDRTIKTGMVGYDIIRGKDQALSLIELNSSPQFDHFLQANDAAPVVDLYRQGLDILNRQSVDQGT